MKGILTVLLLSVFVACSSNSSSSSTSPASADVTAGKTVYNKYCVLCHGDDGKKEMNGAKDITISGLTFDERVALIKGGRNLMTPFEGILTAEEMANVAAYSMTLAQ